MSGEEANEERRSYLLSFACACVQRRGRLAAAHAISRALSLAWRSISRATSRREKRRCVCVALTPPGYSAPSVQRLGPSRGRTQLSQSSSA